MIHVARSKKGKLTVVRLDMANAHGSIPYDLIRTVLKHYHIHVHIKGLISSYLRGIKFRFKTKDYTTHWQNAEIGIVTGCAVSPILFIIGMKGVKEWSARSCSKLK